MSIILLSLLLAFTGNVYAITKGSSTAVSVQDYYQFKASGSGNLMNTFGFFKNGFGLDQPSATCTFQSVFPVAGNVSLHGGNVRLLTDLVFSDMTNLETGGSFICNGYKIDFASSITGIPATYDTAFDGGKLFLQSNINLEGVVQFDGNCIVNGGGNTILLDAGADVRVGSNSTLTLCNVNLHGLSVGNLRCIDDTGSLVLRNCHLLLARDYVFDKGHLGFKGDVMISGTVKFSYASGVTSTLYSNALVTLDNGLTFSYDPATPRKDLICFEDECSMLYLNGATLLSTPTGITFSRGHIFVDQTSVMYAKSLSYPSGGVYTGGIAFGKNNASDDCMVTVLAGAKLALKKGPLHYRNIRRRSWSMASPTSTLCVNSGATLTLDQTLTLGEGRIQSRYTSFLSKKAGASLIGEVEVLKA